MSGSFYGWYDRLSYAKGTNRNDTIPNKRAGFGCRRGSVNRLPCDNSGLACAGFRNDACAGFNRDHAKGSPAVGFGIGEINDNKKTDGHNENHDKRTGRGKNAA